jgi:ArsR family transcriptional regulator
MSIWTDVDDKVKPVKTDLVLTPPSARVSPCDGALSEPLDRAQAQELAGLLKAVADPVRLQLISLIRAATSQEACVCDLTDAVGLSQPTVSHHLKVLTEAGLLTRQRRGSWAWFALVPPRVADIAAIFAEPATG